MRCPACGKWNKGSLPNCFYCGTSMAYAEKPDMPELRPDPPPAEPSAARPGQRGAPPARRPERFAQEDAATSLSRREIEDRVERGEQYKQMLQQLRGEEAPTGKSPPGAAEQVHIRKAAPEAEQARPRRAPVSLKGLVSRWQSRQKRRVAKLQKKPYMPVLLRISWYVLLVGFVFAGYFGYATAMDHFSAQQRQLASDQLVSTSKSIVEVSEGQMTIEKAAHDITFFGEDGDVIFIKELKKSYIVSGGKAVVTILDEEMIPERPLEDQEYVETTLTPRISTIKGTQLVLEPIVLRVEIPESEVTVLKPDKLKTETTDSKYAIKMQVQENSIVTLTYENKSQNISDLRDASGQILHNVSVEPIGDNVFTLSVTQPHRRPYVTDIVLTRNRQEIPLSFVSVLPEKISDSTLTIKGSAMPGAEVIIESSHKDEVQYNLETGEFTFVAVFDRIGERTIQVRARKAGLQDSVITHTISYVPAVDAYSKMAWPLVYNELRGNIANNEGRVFVCTGRVKEIISLEPFTFYFDISEDPEKEQLVVMESASVTGVEQGEVYKIFADAQSEYDDLPLLIARYIYTQ